jgi:hypothetical protein
MSEHSNPNTGAMHATDREEDRASKQEDPLTGADADDHMSEPRKKNPRNE